MEVGLFVLGVLIGIGLTWYLQDRYRKDDAQEREANFQTRLAAMQNEVRESDVGAGGDQGPPDRPADGVSRHRSARQAARGRAGPGQARRRAGAGAGDKAAATVRRAARTSSRSSRDAQRCRARRRPSRRHRAPATAATGGESADDLTRIKGIGKVLAKQAHELGITSFHQLAELSPADADRINVAIDFPGRVEREHWIEQAARPGGRVSLDGPW